MLEIVPDTPRPLTLSPTANPAVLATVTVVPLRIVVPLAITVVVVAGTVSVVVLNPKTSMHWSRRPR